MEPGPNRFGYGPFVHGPPSQGFSGPQMMPQAPLHPPAPAFDPGAFQPLQHSGIFAQPQSHVGLEPPLEDPFAPFVDMSAQYNFPPPPPPPGPPPPNGYGNPQYGYAQGPQHHQRGGGPPRGGRGGGPGLGGRGDYQGYNPNQHAGGYNGEGPPQGPPAGAYGGPQNPAPYIGPQLPAGNHPPHQWQHDQHHQPQGPPQPYQQHPSQMNGPPVPAPLSAQNYHPNYAPQGYNQPPQYGPQQPPQFQNPPPQPPSYGHAPPPNAAQQPPHGGPPQQWQGPPQQSPFNGANRGGRGGFAPPGRGGFVPARGGHDVPLMGPPIRMGFDNDQAQASNGFPPPQYGGHHQSPPPFSQPAYQGYPQHNYGGQRPPLDPNPYNSNPHRGRGGMNFRGGRGGGRGGGGGDHFQFRAKQNQPHNQNRDSRGSQASDTPQKPAVAENGGKKKKKRKTNTLGLTPNGVEHEESEEEDDVDEEARLVSLLGPDTPQLPSDLKAWIEERKKNFPTKARKEAADEELRKRREQAQNSKPVKENKEGETKLEKQQRKAEELRLQLEKAEKKIQDAMQGGTKRKREAGDEGEVSDSDDSSDSEPETQTSRNTAPVRVQPAPKAQLQRHCKYFSTGGTCGKKGKCRFVHDQAVRDQALRDKEANGGKMTLAQRLILNDTAKDDLTILKSIKYLKEKGLMSDHNSGIIGGNPNDYSVDVFGNAIKEEDD